MPHTVGRLPRIVGACTLIVVCTTPRPRAEGVGTRVRHLLDLWVRRRDKRPRARCPLGLALMHPDGSGQVPLTEDGSDAEPAWSPDGLQLAFSRSGDVYVMPATGGTPLNLTNHPAGDASPAWAPDGRTIAFTSNREGLPQLYLMNADGSNVVRLAGALGYAGEPAWSADGSTLAFDCVIDDGNGDVCTVRPDGSAFRRLTTDPASDSAPAWSPDGATVAFASYRYATTEWPFSAIALMDAEGRNVRPTAAAGERPSWSPDGAQIAFHVIFEDLSEWPPPPTEMVIGVINVADGTVAHIMSGFDAAWRANGANLPPVPSIGVTCLAHVCSFNASSSVDPDGSINSYVWDFGDGTTGSGAAVSHTYPSGTPYIATLTLSDDNGGTASRSRTVEPNARPLAYAAVTCNGRTCSFDGSKSWDDGTIASYVWSFGDGTLGSGVTIVHTYATPGIYFATLTVTDNEGVTAGPIARTALASTPPIASFTFTCTELACVFDASGSTDPDGTVASYEWNLGGTGPLVSHTFAGPGEYVVHLIVRDNLGLWDEQRTSITVPYDIAHVGDLDGAASLHQSLWNATVTITVHDSRHAAVSGALVTGLWTGGTSATCTTNGEGQCAVTRSGIPRKTTSVGFSVTNVTRPAFVYNAAANHDPDGSSSGNGILVIKP